MIIPAILAHSSEELIQKIQSIQDVVSLAHLDVINDSLVSGESFWNTRELAAIKTSLHFEVHIMTDYPARVIARFADNTNIKRVYFHIEAQGDPRESIEEAVYHGFACGIVLNPETDWHEIIPFLNEIDALLFMGIQPGASGRPLDSRTFAKIASFHSEYPKVEIAVDGAVNPQTIVQFRDVGATRFVAGSAIFNERETPDEAIKKLQSLIS